MSERGGAHARPRHTTSAGITCSAPGPAARNGPGEKATSRRRTLWWLKNDGAAPSGQYIKRSRPKSRLAAAVPLPHGATTCPDYRLSTEPLNANHNRDTLLGREKSAPVVACSIRRDSVDPKSPGRYRTSDLSAGSVRSDRARGHPMIVVPDYRGHRIEVAATPVDMQREPATLTCVVCGRWALLLDATEPQRIAQRDFDVARRPRSAECNAEYNVPRPLGGSPAGCAYPAKRSRRLGGR
jgi:hypothetical protein